MNGWPPPPAMLYNHDFTSDGDYALVMERRLRTGEFPQTPSRCREAARFGLPPAPFDRSPSAGRLTDGPSREIETAELERTRCALPSISR